MINRALLRSTAIQFLAEKRLKRPRYKQSRISEDEIFREEMRLKIKVATGKIKSLFNDDDPAHRLAFAVIDQAVTDLVTIKMCPFESKISNKTWFRKQEREEWRAINFLLNRNPMAELCGVNSEALAVVVRACEVHPLNRPAEYPS